MWSESIDVINPAESVCKKKVAEEISKLKEANKQTCASQKT